MSPKQRQQERRRIGRSDRDGIAAGVIPRVAKRSPVVAEARDPLIAKEIAGSPVLGAQEQSLFHRPRHLASVLLEEPPSGSSFRGPGRLE